MQHAAAEKCTVHCLSVERVIQAAHEQARPRAAKCLLQHMFALHAVLWKQYSACAGRHVELCDESKQQGDAFICCAMHES